MGSVPPVVFVVPVVAVIAAVVLPRLTQQLAASAGAGSRYAGFRLGELAPRLGLRIVEGDPELDMMQAHVVHNMARGRSTGGVRGLAEMAKETRVLLEGEPYGRPTRFSFLARTQGAELGMARLVRRQFDCRLSLQVPVELPPFEIVLRRPGAGLKVQPQLRLPAQSFDDPWLDARLVLTCADPRLGPLLASAAAGLAEHGYLHVEGTGDRITSHATEAGMMAAMYHLAETQQALEHLATVLAGPVVPHR